MPRKLTQRKIESRLKVLIERLSTLFLAGTELPDPTRQGDPGSILEALCGLLLDHQVPVEAAFRAEIAVLGEALGISSTSWKRITEES